MTGFPGPCSALLVTALRPALCRGYVRCQALSANQILHVPGAGDFQIQGIRAWTPSSAQHPAQAKKRPRQEQVGPAQPLVPLGWNLHGWRAKSW